MDIRFAFPLAQLPWWSAFALLMIGLTVFALRQSESIVLLVVLLVVGILSQAFVCESVCGCVIVRVVDKTKKHDRLGDTRVS